MSLANDINCFFGKHQHTGYIPFYFNDEYSGYYVSRCIYCRKILRKKQDDFKYIKLPTDLFFKEYNS